MSPCPLLLTFESHQHYTIFLVIYQLVPLRFLIAFDIDRWDNEAFKSLPEWIQERIKKSTQYQKLHVPTDSVDVNTNGAQQSKAAGGAQEQKEENPI